LVRARHIAAAAIASLLVAAAFSVPTAHAQTKAPPACEDAAGLAVLASPLAPWKGAPLRVVVAVEQAFAGELSLTAPDGTVAAKSREREGGPPYFWYAEVAAPAAGAWHATLALVGAPAECATITRAIAVQGKQPPGQRATQGSVWPARGCAAPNRGVTAEPTNPRSHGPSRSAS